MIIFIDNSRLVRDDDSAAVACERSQGVGSGIRHQVLHWHDHETVAREVVSRPAEIRRHPETVEGIVPEACLIEQARVDRGVRIQLACPAGIRVVNDRDGRSGHAGADDFGDRSEVGAKLDHLTPDPRIGAGMGKQRRVELLRPGFRGTPLEEQGRICTASDVL